MKKNAFTLAEILIVVSIIGLIAAYTVPSLLRGVIEKQWKSSYKKAYNVIFNLYSSERAVGFVPYSADSASVLLMFKSLNSHLSIKDYAAPPDENKINSEALYDINKYYNKVNFGLESNGENILVYDTNSTVSPWIITEDNIAYSVISGDGCSTLETINSADSHVGAKKFSCVLIVVDVNGLNNGPNRIEPQIISDNALKTDDAMDILTGDRFYIYVGLNGITAGNKKNSVMGRIIADVK